MKERADNRRTIQERERKNNEGKSRQLKNHTRKRKEKYMRTGERVSRKTTSEKEKGGNRWIGRGIICIEKRDGRTRETRPGRRERKGGDRGEKRRRKRSKKEGREKMNKIKEG